MTELTKKIFKGLRQVNLSTYKKCTDKEGFLWLIRDGEDRSIFFGNQKYASLSQTSSGGDPTEAITAAIENLIRQDLLHSFDSEGQLKNEINLSLKTEEGKQILHLTGKDGEEVANVDMSRFAIDGMVDNVTYDANSHSLNITWNTAAGKEATTVDLTDLIDVYIPGNGIDITNEGVISIRLSNDSQDFLTLDNNGLKLTNIDGKHIELGDKITVDDSNELPQTSKVTDVLQTLFDTLKTVKDNSFDYSGDDKSIVVTNDTGQNLKKIISLNTEVSSDETINQGHIEVKSDENGVFAQMYYMSDIESVTGVIANPLITGENISLYQASVEDNKRLDLQATNEVELEDVTFKGDFPKATANTIVKINGGKTVTLNGVKFDDTVKGYNGIEIGLSSNNLPKTVNIKNCDFKGKIDNNAISIFGTENDAVINIENCHFASVSNVLRLSNKTNTTNVTVNVKDCIVDQWDPREEFEGFLICQDYTSPSLTEANKNNLFSPNKITVKFNNLIYKGEKVTADTSRRLVYVSYNNGGYQTDETKIPRVIIV